MNETADWLDEQRLGLGDAFLLDFQKALQVLAVRPWLARPNGTSPTRLWSMRKWHKVLVLKATQRTLHVVTIRDVRQLNEN